MPDGEYLLVNYDNPVLTPETRQLFIDHLYQIDEDTALGGFYKRFEELGPRYTDLDSDYIRLLAGLRGDLGPAGSTTSG